MLLFPILSHASRKPTWRSWVWFAKFAWYDVTWKPLILFDIPLRCPYISGLSYGSQLWLQFNQKNIAYSCISHKLCTSIIWLEIIFAYKGLFTKHPNHEKWYAFRIISNDTKWYQLIQICCIIRIVPRNKTQFANSITIFSKLISIWFSILICYS